MGQDMLTTGLGPFEAIVEAPEFLTSKHTKRKSPARIIARKLIKMRLRTWK